MCVNAGVDVDSDDDLDAAGAGAGDDNAAGAGGCALCVDAGVDVDAAGGFIPKKFLKREPKPVPFAGLDAGAGGDDAAVPKMPEKKDPIPIYYLLNRKYKNQTLLIKCLK